jgi:hypothetical protein
VKKAVVMLVVVLFGFALALGYARANPGALDPTWGEEGVVLTDFEGMDDILNTLTLMPDEKLAAAGWVNVWPGDYGVARYLRDGRLDPSFGDGGLVTTAFFDDPDLVDAAWALPPGRKAGFICLAKHVTPITSHVSLRWRRIILTVHWTNRSAMAGW